MKKICLLSVISISFMLTSCLKDKTTPIDPAACTTIVSYSLDIVPIINTSCVTNQGPGTGCHDAWIFEYAAVETYLDLNIWQNEVLVEKTMPEIPNIFGIDSLTNEQLQLMECWINQGYPEN